MSLALRKSIFSCHCHNFSLRTHSCFVFVFVFVLQSLCFVHTQWTAFVSRPHYLSIVQTIEFYEIGYRDWNRNYISFYSPERASFFIQLSGVPPMSHYKHFIMALWWLQNSREGNGHDPNLWAYNIKLHESVITAVIK